MSNDAGRYGSPEDTDVTPDVDAATPPEETSADHDDGPLPGTGTGPREGDETVSARDLTELQEHPKPGEPTD